jgi:hypothetical protein
MMMMLLLLFIVQHTTLFVVLQFQMGSLWEEEEIPYIYIQNSYTGNGTIGTTWKRHAWRMGWQKALQFSIVPEPGVLVIPDFTDSPIIDVVGRVLGLAGHHFIQQFHTTITENH